MNKPDTSGLAAIDIATQTVSRQRWAVMGLYWLGNLATILPMFSLLVMLPQISQEFSLTSFEMGLLSSIAWLTMAAFALPFGAWLSMYRPKPLVTAMLFLGALAGLAQAWAPSYSLLFLSRLAFVVSGVARFRKSVV